MERIRSLHDLTNVGAVQFTVAKLHDGPEGSPALRRQVTRVLAAWSQNSVNGRDDPEKPARLPSLFDRVRKMLGQEGIGLYVDPGEVASETRGLDRQGPQANRVVEFFLKADGA